MMSFLRYPSDLTHDEWALVEPLIPPAKRGGERTVIMRGGGERPHVYSVDRLPSGGPFRKTCRRVRPSMDISICGAGVTDRIHHMLDAKFCERLAGKPVPPPPSSTARASKALKKMLWGQAGEQTCKSSPRSNSAI